jgi:allantoinase
MARLAIAIESSTTISACDKVASLKYVTQMAEYPRNLVGYADKLPDPRWPGGARIAVNFVLNYEEGGERNVLHGDKVSETRLADLVVPAPIEGARDLNMESAYEYGSRIGFWRLMRLFAERQVPLTIYAVGMALERNPRAAEAMARHGCDIVDHGWRWLDYHGVDEATEREHIRLSVETIRRLFGTRPVGWYIGTPSANTRRLVVEEGGFLYDSDAYNDELPYWTNEQGRPHLIIPHTLDDNDTRLARGLGWAQAQDFFISLRDNFNALYDEGTKTPKLMTVALHCRLAGKPARAAAFARFIDYVLRHDKVWICRRNEIAEHWRRYHPYTGG